MSSFQVYIPGVQGATLAHLDAVGLGGLRDPNVSPDCQDATLNTPDGKRGVVFFWIDHGNPLNNPRHIGMHPEIQWSPAKPNGELPAGRFYLGKCEDEVVTPDALLRKDNLGGEAVELEDGQHWIIPVAKQLPKKYIIDEQTGCPRLAVKKQYEEFYDEAEKNYRVLMQRVPGEDITIAGGWKFAEKALAYNYRINSDVIDWLGLIGEVSMLWLIGATFELTKLNEIEAQKKTAY